MSHNEDDIPLLVSSSDILMRLGNLLQRIAPIDDRLQPPRLDQSFEEVEAFGLFAGWRLNRDVGALGLERALALRNGGLAYGVKDNVIGLPPPGEILAGVVDDAISPQSFHPLQIRCAAHCGDPRPKVPGQL